LTPVSRVVSEAVPGAPKQDPILVVDGLRREFGGLVAVDIAHLEVQRGAITALIGPNGAGKTTAFNLMSGFDTPTAGSSSFDGHNTSEVSGHRLAQLGMVRTFQLTRVLTRLTVLENMMLGAVNQIGEKPWTSPFKPLWAKQDEQIRERAEELLVRFKLDHVKNEYAGNISGGQRKLLEMARALMVEPKLVMLDEPMAGVNPALKQSLLGHVKNLQAEGMTVLFIEHDMDMVHEIADWVMVMAEGRLIAEGTPDQISNNRAVVDAYLGEHQGTSFLEDV
jgi:neutral amino acid transport system ATP-binding protein